MFSKDIERELVTTRERVYGFTCEANEHCSVAVGRLKERGKPRLTFSARQSKHDSIARVHTAQEDKTQ